jgi:hypothetical protein
MVKAAPTGALLMARISMILMRHTSAMNPMIAMEV